MDSSLLYRDAKTRVMTTMVSIVKKNKLYYSVKFFTMSTKSEKNNLLATYIYTSLRVEPCGSYRWIKNMEGDIAPEPMGKLGKYIFQFEQKVERT